MALESLPGGIASLWDGIARQKITTIYAVIRAAAADRQGAEIALAYAATIPLVRYTPLAQAACLALFAAILAPAQGEATPSPAPASDPMPLSRFFTELFSRATSWLHWPPSEVWNASVAEIVTALEAQAERELRLAGIPSDKSAPAGNYTPERLRQIEEQDFDPAFDREGLRALKARHQ
ncbi:hypothetical protein [Rhodobacter sp. 24-YEA-8]|uniref:hypothetical protein n=1 Tax=Rhodobacter sp. 24-YEA-8 TaxID=1884310 RepID=UPI00115FF665|nr:hypothetical protein [Rhodobacter sp. 24-YEA-8]